MNVVIDRKNMCASYGGVVCYGLTQKTIDEPGIVDDMKNMVRDRVRIILSMPDSNQLVVVKMPDGVRTFAVAEAQSRLRTAMSSEGML